VRGLRVCDHMCVRAVWAACMMCLFLTAFMRAWTVCVSVWTACVDCVCGLCVWTVFVDCVKNTLCVDCVCITTCVSCLCLCVLVFLSHTLTCPKPFVFSLIFGIVCVRLGYLVFKQFKLL
jgi:hypothetical protein